MKWIRVFLVAAVAVSFAFVARALRSDATSTTQVMRPLVAADAIDPERLGEVLLTRDGVLYRFVRKGDSWSQTEPVVHPVDGWSMKQLASRVLKLEVVRIVSSGATSDATAALHDAGLAPPLGRLELRELAQSDGSRRTIVIDLGRRSLAGRAFARVESSDAASRSANDFAVVNAGLHEFAIDREVHEFRRRELFVDLGEVDRVEFSSGDKRTELVRKGRTFRVESPVQARADRAQAEELVDALRRARSSGFVTDAPTDLAVYGLAPPAAMITVWSGNTQTNVLIGDPVSIGAQDRFGLVEGTSTVLRLSATTLATALPRVERLVDAIASGVRAADVGALEIALTSGQRITLRREVNKWTATVSEQGATTEPRVLAVDSNAVERLLAALTQTRAASLEIAAFPAQDAVGLVTFFGFGNEPIDTVRVARRQEQGATKTILENGDGVLRVHGAIDLPLSADELALGVTQP